MTNAKRIRAVERGIGILKALNEGYGESLVKLSENTGLPKSTLLRFLGTFEEAGWVYRYRVDGSYRLASSICSMGEQIVQHDCLVELALPILDALTDDVGWPADLAVCAKDKMQILDSTRRMCSKVDEEDFPQAKLSMIRSAVGLAFLAYCSEDQCQSIVQAMKDDAERLNYPLPPREQLKNLCEQVRMRGYSFYQSAYAHEHCAYNEIAVPVIIGNKVNSCISLTWPEQEVGFETVDEIFVPALKRAAEAIESKLREETIAGVSIISGAA